MFLSNFEGGNSHVSYSPPTTPTIHTSSFASNGSSRNWSSIIGIVTAIIGNILISFALNTQRYAHIKLSRERDVELEKQKPKRDGITGYGTQQARIAEERAVKVHKTQQNGAVVDGQQDESAPLLGSGNGKTSTGSSDSSKSSSTEKSYLQSPWWWLGITLMVLGECGNFLAYGFAPASVVSPLGVVALVSNCLIAPLMLHERFRLRDALGVVIAVAGCVTVVLSAKGSNPRLGADEIWKLIATWEFETYLACTVILIVVLLWASTKYGDRTILIDLGLVGLFGQYWFRQTHRALLTVPRWLHCTIYQGHRITLVKHHLARCDFSPHLSPTRDTHHYCCHADQVRQPGFAAIRLDSSHPDSIRTVHAIRDYW